MKARIADEIHRGELSACSTAVARAVISAINYYERRRFPWNEFEGELKTTVASTTAVTLSITSVPNIINLDSVRMVIGQRDYPIPEVPWSRMEAIDSGQYFGYPEMYSIHSNKVRLYPPPDSAYPMRWAGIKKLDDVSLNATAAASNKWLTDGEELIRLRAKTSIFRDNLRNPNLAQFFQAESERVYGELHREVLFKAASGRVRPTRF